MDRNLNIICVRLFGFLPVSSFKHFPSFRICFGFRISEFGFWTPLNRPPDFILNNSSFLPHSFFPISPPHSALRIPHSLQFYPKPPPQPRLRLPPPPSSHPLHCPPHYRQPHS